HSSWKRSNCWVAACVSASQSATKSPTFRRSSATATGRSAHGSRCCRVMSALCSRRTGSPCRASRWPISSALAIRCWTRRSTWLQQDLEAQALTYAIAALVPEHFDEVKRRKEELIAKTIAAVKDRLTKEIVYWDHRAEELKAQEQAGRTPRLNSAKARQRADE